MLKFLTIFFLILFVYIKFIYYLCNVINNTINKIIMKTKIYIVHETYSNDGEITNTIIAASFDKEKARQAMKAQFEKYKGYGVFDYDDEEYTTIDICEDSMYITNGDYYGDLQILEKEVI